MTVLILVWVDHREDLADLRRVLQPVQPGQAVYVAEVGIDERQPTGSQPALAPAVQRHSPRRTSGRARLDRAPSLLAIRIRRPVAAADRDAGTLPHPGNPDRPPAEFQQAAVADVCGFDYVLLMEADAVPDLPTARFRLLQRSGFAALYAITHCKDDP